MQKSKVGERVRRYSADDAVYWIAPAKIVWVTASKAFDIREHKGRVVGGDWDKLVLKFEDLDIYRSFMERSSTGEPWSELPYYRSTLAAIESGVPLWNCKTREDLDRRCVMLDSLLYEIKTKGYKTQLVLEKEKCRILDPEDEITVNIGRHGDLLFSNGRHRLSCAKIAGVRSVPVKITVRHAEWEEFKRQIYSYVERNKGAVYAPLTHIDLQSIPSHHSHQRFEIIRNNIGQGSQTLLDIGAHWGYFCHKFEEEGYKCFAVEQDGEHLYFMRKLRRAENKEFAIISDSILDMGEKGSLEYDVVLALAIFHHFLKTERLFNKLKTLLGNLHCNEVFFLPHAYNDPQMAGAFVNFTPEQFVQFILENSRLTEYKLIGHCEGGRPLYKLWR
ncbi:MAG: hypothetical protein FJ004_01980 [Chloroflexi bacterium]|nr:hypothetical protein [Chloroflexota bacterium]